MKTQSGEGKRAAIYARVSTEEQEENNSIPEQLYECRKYAKEHGYQVVGEYIDAESGLQGERTQLRSLLARAKRKEFEVVIVKKLDRLGRGLRGFYRPYDELKEAGVETKFTLQEYPEEFLPMLAAFAEMEVKMIKERTSSGRRQMARAGKINPVPRPLYGYAYDPKMRSFVINEEEAKWIRQIFAWHLEGMGISRIAWLLDGAGVASRREQELTDKLRHLDDPAWCEAHKVRDVEAKRSKVRGQLSRHRGWNRLVIHNMLKNASYYGEGYVNKHEGRKRVLRPREEWIPFPYPPIIDEETFAAAQRMTERLRNYRELKRTGRQYMLHGIFYCDECQKHFVITYVPWHTVLKGGTHKTYPRGTRGYRCAGMRYQPHLFSCRKPANVVAHRVEQVVWEQVCEGLQNPELLTAALQIENEETQLRSSALQEEIEHLERRLAELDVQTQRILRLYATGKWRDVDLNLQRSVITEEREALERALRDKHEQTQRQIDFQELLRRVAEIGETVRHLPRTIKDMGPEVYRQAAEVVRLIVERVLLDGQGKVTIEMAIGQVSPNEPIAEPVSGSTQSW